MNYLLLIFQRFYLCIHTLNELSTDTVLILRNMFVICVHCTWLNNGNINILFFFILRESLRWIENPSQGPHSLSNIARD